MVGVHTLMDRNKVPNPEFLLLQEHFVDFLRGESLNIVQTVEDVEFEKLMGIAVVSTFVHKMLYYSASFPIMFDVGLVVPTSGFPVDRRSHSLFPTIQTFGRIYNVWGFTVHDLPNLKCSTSREDLYQRLARDKVLARIACSTFVVTPYRLGFHRVRVSSQNEFL